MTDFSRATIADVAERAGVSIATVSRVLNKTGQVSSVTATRVQTAIEELNFTPHAAARGLASRKTNTIGLILREIGGEFFQPMLRGIEAGTREHGYDLLIHCTHRIHGQGLPPHYPLSEHNSDGLLVFTDSLDEAEIIRLHHAQFPLVLLHRSSPDGLDIPCVTVENKLGARRLVDYLIEERGYHRIAFLAGPEDAEDSHWREMGYRDALEAHGISFDPALMRVGGFRAVTELLEDGVRPDAIFCGDDDTAIGALAALKASGLRVPEDIALVGFDDIPVARHLNPPLTTVRAPIETAAREAVQQLVRLIRTSEAEKLILLPTELVIRRSCGAAG
ncbi:MAG: LacI family transcriptional regulator [Anaerolineae bacterium]|nr:LacI family transcriptional regulator [Anaerolineae bacterium]